MKPATSNESVLPEFVDQKMISDPVPSSLLDSDIQKLKNAFPAGTIFRACDPNTHADFRSDKWICFPEFPFTLGLKYPFPDIFSDFFGMTGLCYSQTMPMIWRTLFVIQSVNDSYQTHVGIPEVAQTYHLRSHGSNYFLLKIKPNRQHLVHCVTQNDPGWKERFFFVDRKSLPDEELIPTVWRSKVIFEKSAPPLPDTEKLIEDFLKVPESNRTFSHPRSPGIMKSQKATPTTPASFFSLSDIDDEDLSIKKEKSMVESSKARAPNTRSRSTTKKRKANVTEDPDESILDFNKAMEQVSKCYEEKMEMIESIKKSAAIAAKTSSQEIAFLKREIEDIRTFAAQKDVETQKKIEEEREILVADIKKDAAAAVLKARILMVTEASARGLDTSFWNVQAWQGKLAKLKGEDPEVGIFLDEASGKGTKTPAKKTPDASTQKVPIEIEDTEMDNPEPASKIPKGPSEFEDSSPGKEGI